MRRASRLAPLVVRHVICLRLARLRGLKVKLRDFTISTSPGYTFPINLYQGNRLLLSGRFIVTRPCSRRS